MKWFFPYWQPDQILEIYKWGKSKWSFSQQVYFFQTLEVMICIIAIVWVTIILKVSFIIPYMLRDLFTAEEYIILPVSSSEYKTSISTLLRVTLILVIAFIYC